MKVWIVAAVLLAVACGRKTSEPQAEPMAAAAAPDDPLGTPDDRGIEDPEPTSARSNDPFRRPEGHVAPSALSDPHAADPAPSGTGPREAESDEENPPTIAMRAPDDASNRDALAQLVGDPSECLPPTSGNVAPHITLDVLVFLDRDGRIGDAELRSPDLSKESLACVRTRLLGVRFPGTRARRIETRLVFEPTE